MAGQVSLALRSFEHPGLDRVLQWDLRHAMRLVDRLAGGDTVGRIVFTP